MDKKLYLAERICRVCVVASGVLLLLSPGMTAGAGKDVIGRAASLVFLVSAIAGECISLRRAKLNREAVKKLPRVNDFAEVIRKRTWTDIGIGARGISTTGGRTHWYVTFETKNYGVCELAVPCETYHALRRNAKGRLCMKGGAFIAFRAEGEGE